MTQVDFYILDSKDPQARQLFACRLSEKAYRLGHRVYIQTESEHQSRILDDLLWTFRAGSFLPHAVATDKLDRPKPPVLVGTGLASDIESDVIINLASDMPAGYDRCERVAELVDQNSATKAAGRLRFKHYKKAGCNITSHEIGSLP